MFASMSHGFKEAAKQQGGPGAAEIDEIKRMLMETKPWFLALTALVSVLHMVYVIILSCQGDCLTPYLLGSRYWLSSQMCPIGGRSVNSSECPSGTILLAIDPAH
jgi:hypothetical protein